MDCYAELICCTIFVRKSKSSSDHLISFLASDPDLLAKLSRWQSKTGYLVTNMVDIISLYQEYRKRESAE